MLTGELEPTYWLGAATAVRAIIPIALRYTIASESYEKSNSNLYQVAWTSWYLLNSVVYGFLTLIWPVSYFHITVLTDFYLSISQVVGIEYTVFVIGTVSALFLLGAMHDSSAWIYFALHLGFEFGVSYFSS